MARQRRLKNVIIGITLDTVAKIALDLQSSKLSDEPSASLDECKLGSLASALKTPFLRPASMVNNEEIAEKAALLFCLIIQNHSFVNGNKRVAVAALITFLNINGYITNVSDIKLYAYSMGVTLLSKYKLYKEAVTEIKDMLMDTLEKKKGKPTSSIDRKALNSEFIRFMQSPV